MKFKKIYLMMAILLIASAFSSGYGAFLCGDANGNGKVDLIDISYIINALYRGGPAPISWDAVDVDNSGKCNLRDVSYLITYLYRNGLDPVCPDDGPSGGLIGHSSCGGYLTALRADASRDNYDGIAYEYDGAGILSLLHENAGLNCCPIFASIITVDGNNIIIEEIDSLDQGGCDCLCLFDLDYRILDLSPGFYHIKVIEPFIGSDKEQLEFDVDLSTATSGFYFVLRNYYPWGEM